MENPLRTKLPLFVLDDAVLLPGAVARLETDETGASTARSLARSDERRVAVALSTEGTELSVYPIAALARVEGVAADRGVIVSAIGPAPVLSVEETGQLPRAEVEILEPQQASGTEVEALALEARRLARDILALLPSVPAEVSRNLHQIRDPGGAADLPAY